MKRTYSKADLLKGARLAVIADRIKRDKVLADMQAHSYNGHIVKCPDCGTNLTSLLLCPDCGKRYKIVPVSDIRTPQEGGYVPPGSKAYNVSKS